MSTSSNKIALRYIAAFLDIAEEKKKIDAIAKDMTDLTAMFISSEDFRKFITSPVIEKKEQMGVVAALAKKAKFNALTANLLCLLVENRRISILGDILKLFETEIAKRFGEVAAEVRSAHILSDKQTKALKDSLKKGLGTDVSLTITEDKSLLGGMTIQIGSVLIDDSVATKLGRLERSLRAGSNNLEQQKEEVA